MAFVMSQATYDDVRGLIGLAVVVLPGLNHKVNITKPVLPQQITHPTLHWNMALAAIYDWSG